MKEEKEMLSETEELDFHYLLSLMPPLHNTPEFAWLPELFSIIGIESFILLCKFCGGERIKIPTLEQLTDDIDALQWYYDVVVTKKKKITDVPVNLHSLFNKILEAFECSDE